MDIKHREAVAGEVWIVVAEKGLHSQVDRGENAGKNLHHASVARWMHRIGLANPEKPEASSKIKASVKLKPSWNLENLKISTFVQEPRSKQILGAASIACPR